MKKSINYFLDYEIVNTGNGDGFVITKPKGEFYECHLGNYSSLENAQKDCIRYFMIARPSEFATQLIHRLHGHYTYMDFFKFVEVLQEEGFTVPEEIGCSDDSNCILTYKGEKI